MRKKIISVRANNGFHYSQTNTLAFTVTQIFRFSENQKDKDLKKELKPVLKEIHKINKEVYKNCSISKEKRILNLIRFAYEYSNEIGKRVAKLFHRENFNPSERQIEI